MPHPAVPGYNGASPVQPIQGNLHPMRLVSAVLLAVIALPALAHAQRASLPLDGTWSFKQDPQSEGEAQGWATSEIAFPRTILVPGAWQAQGVGEAKGTLRHDYAGVAWYRRTIDVPSAWRGKAVSIRIGGAHRETTVYVNGREVGRHRGFSAPFAFDVTEAIRPGASNVVALRIANPGAVPLEGPREQKGDQPTGMLNYIGNWGGVYGSVELRATSATAIAQVYVRPDVTQRTARFVVSVANREAGAFSGEVDVAVGPRATGRAALTVAANGKGEATVIVPMPDARLWTPEDPHLYTARITLRRARQTLDQLDERFGMRQFTTRGNVLLLNGTPIYLRGYGDDNIEVLTGFPPSSPDVYRERLRRARDFGFNTVRFHSMTPPEEFFRAADEVGLLVMAELPAAYTQYVLPHRDLLRQELIDVVLAYRNRPSLLSLAFGNEFNLTWLETDAERKTFLDTVAEFYALAKSLHPDGLVLSNDGYVMKPTDLVSHYGAGVPDLPVVKHEFGEYYCSLPDIALKDRFTGVFLPGWLDAKTTWVQAHGIADRYPTYVRNSQRLQQLGRKYQIERVRRRQDVTGYHYWLIVDFPGGTGEGDSWEEGWFDYFWQPKHITPGEGRAINASVLPMIEAGVGDRAHWSDEPRAVEVLVSNYGSTPLAGTPLTWSLVADGRKVAGDSIPISQALGTVGRVATIALPAMKVATAQQLELSVGVAGGEVNSWTFWAFPRDTRLGQSPTPVRSSVKWAGISRLYPFVRDTSGMTAGDGLLLTPTLDEAALEHLQAGGRVWLMQDRMRGQDRTEVSFFPAAGGALGTVIAEGHPALAGFPHQGFADLQFYNLMDGATPVVLDRAPKGLEPIIGGIRTKASFLAKTKDLSRVGYAFEAKVGRGRLLVTSLRFRDHFDEAFPEALSLFDGLLRYATGETFAPAVTLDTEELRRLVGTP
jgi:beta-galactosidase